MLRNPLITTYLISRLAVVKITVVKITVAVIAVVMVMVNGTATYLGRFVRIEGLHHDVASLGWHD